MTTDLRTKPFIRLQKSMSRDQESMRESLYADGFNVSIIAKPQRNKIRFDLVVHDGWAVGESAVRTLNRSEWADMYAFLPIWNEADRATTIRCFIDDNEAFRRMES